MDNLRKLQLVKYAALRDSYWVDDIRKEIVGDRHYNFNYLTDESKELLEALWNRDLPNIREEIGDVAYAAQMLTNKYTGLNFPMVGGREATDKFLKRIDVLKPLVESYGVEFSPDFLSGGSNYKKPEKVKAILGKAGIDVTDDDIPGIYGEIAKYETAVDKKLNKE